MLRPLSSRPCCTCGGRRVRVGGEAGLDTSFLQKSCKIADLNLMASHSARISDIDMHDIFAVPEFIPDDDASPARDTRDVWHQNVAEEEPPCLEYA